MEEVSNAILQMVVLLVITAVGYVAARVGYLDNHVKDKIMVVLMNITLPCMIVASAGNIDASALGTQVPLVIALGALEFFLWLGVTFVFVHVFRVRKDQRPIYYLMTTCTNTSFVGIPVANALFGGSSVILCSMFIMITSALMYSIGIGILVAGRPDDADALEAGEGSQGEGPARGGSAPHASSAGSGSAPHASSAGSGSAPHASSAGSGSAPHASKAKQVVKAVISPLTISALFALFLVFSGLHLPSVIQDCCDTLGSITPTLAMMMVGVIIQQERLRDVVREWRLYPYIVIRQLIAPALGFLVLRMFVSDPVLIGVLIVMFAMPVGSMASMYCASYGHDAVLPAKGTILSTVASFAIIPILVSFMLSV